MAYLQGFMPISNFLMGRRLVGLSAWAERAAMGTPHPRLPHHGLPHHGYGYEAAGYCANGGSCVPPVFCSPNYLESLYDPAAPCYLAHGTPGVCCLPRKHPCE